MKLHEFRNVLAKHPECTLRFLLPNGERVPAHAHVTEVARIEKRFMDCGGTLRHETLCRLQTWTADDFEHRLTAGKLRGILDRAAVFLGADDMEVDVEHEVRFVSQFPLESVEAGEGQLVVKLAQRHTACLATDKCLPRPKAESILLKTLPTFR